MKWCNARSQQRIDTGVLYGCWVNAGVYQWGGGRVYVDWVAKGYRLPTEAEWERAARGPRSNQRFPWGNTISESQANYDGYTAGYNYDLGPNGFNATYAIGGYPYTSPVGSFAPNGYGLYDMAGNVAEWCWDWYGTPYAGGIDLAAPRQAPTVCYGAGTWSFFAFLCRTANRFSYIPTYSDDDIGFRSVLPSGQ